MSVVSERGARLLGIDFGEKRIGVALGVGSLAVPVTIVEHTNRAADLDALAAIALRERVTAIVVGIPLAPDGGEGEQARLTRAFGRQLAERTSLPVAYQDERLSSIDAAPMPRRGKHIDDLAAAAILQRYLDAQEARA
jgi:putative Holliday junction resolvase